MSDYLVWIDCEMTGLDLRADALIEVALLMTDAELNIVGDGVDVVIKPPQEALDQMEAGYVPDLCLIDWNMPVMDGYTFITEVRKRPEWRNVTLMMVTTESEQGQIVKALAAGAHEYVIKPFTPDAIVEKLELLGLSGKGIPA